MKVTAEQMTLFDFLNDPDPIKETVLYPSEIQIVATEKDHFSSERKSILALEPVPKEFDGIKVGSVCEIIAEDPRKERLPHLFIESQIGQRIVVTQLSADRGARWVWGYRLLQSSQPLSTEKRSKRLEYDPSCSVSPHPVEWLRLLDSDTSQLAKQLDRVYRDI